MILKIRTEVTYQWTFWIETSLNSRSALFPFLRLSNNFPEFREIGFSIKLLIYVDAHLFKLWRLLKRVSSLMRVHQLSQTFLRCLYCQSDLTTSPQSKFLCFRIITCSVKLPLNQWPGIISLTTEALRKWSSRQNTESNDQLSTEVSSEVFSPAYIHRVHRFEWNL